MTQEMCTYVHSMSGKIGNAHDAVVLAQIALHADANGEALMTWEELMRHANCSRTSMWRSITRLGSAGWIKRRQWAPGTANSSTLFTLSERIVAEAGAVEKAKPRGFVSGVRRQARRHDGMDGDSFAALLAQALEEGWDSEPAQRLAQVVAVQAPARLGWLASRLESAGSTDASAELVSRAWEAVSDHADSVLKAEEPWAMLAAIVRNDLNREFRDRREWAVDPSSPAFDRADGAQASGSAEISAVSVRATLEGEDGVNGAAHLVAALIGAGVPKGLAANGTRRVMEIAATTALTKAHTEARRDALLHALGVPEKAAGAWMGLVVGTRRAGPSSSYLLRAAKGDTRLDRSDEARLATIASSIGQT